MSFHSWFYRSLFYFHAFVAIAEFIVSFSLIILIFITKRELFFKINHPDDDDWELVGIKNWIIIIVLFMVGTIRTVILFFFIFGVSVVTTQFFCLLCTECYRKALCKLFKAKATHRFIAFNCNCPCYRARPTLRFQLQLLFLILVSCIRIATIAFCFSLRHHITAKSLAVVVAISFFFLLLTSLLDYYHYRVWWHYKPQCDTISGTLSKKHKRYIPYHLMGDNRTMHHGDRPCSDGDRCTNRRLEHILIFHSKDFKPQKRYCDVQQKSPGKNLYIGFHRTTAEAAVSIAHSDFAISTNNKSTMLGHGVYFARSMAETEGKANANGAYICAEIEMGKVKEVGPGPEKDSLRGTTHLWKEYDTVYYNHTKDSRDEFCVKSPDQILKWIITVNQEEDEKVRNYRLDTEFDDPMCGCI
ncbi:unnamed protein product [Rotaria magnacalcarata]|uniref:PARP catalytic domain-containing protein n=3 Tax=Rotaria magnacalcarata TaxID=392030 RepID=A0A816TFR7_9BILA|nr:unnamed protein product [Rotaria magnacalcarata]